MTAALIERLEKAEAGSRELDGAISVAFRDLSAQYFEQRWAREWGGPFESHGGIVYLMHADGSRGPNFKSPAYTTSLDAALALAERVLPGWCWELTLMPDEATWQGAPAMWPEGLSAPDRGGVWASMKAPALALCIAILKAKAAQS